jgi:hypothetical protein
MINFFLNASYLHFDRAGLTGRMQNNEIVRKKSGDKNESYLSYWPVQPEWRAARPVFQSPIQSFLKRRWRVCGSDLQNFISDRWAEIQFATLITGMNVWLSLKTGQKQKIPARTILSG